MQLSAVGKSVHKPIYLSSCWFILAVHQVPLAYLDFFLSFGLMKHSEMHIYHLMIFHSDREMHWTAYCMLPWKNIFNKVLLDGRKKHTWTKSSELSCFWIATLGNVRPSFGETENKIIFVSHLHIQIQNYQSVCKLTHTSSSSYYARIFTPKIRM